MIIYAKKNRNQADNLSDYVILDTEGKIAYDLVCVIKGGERVVTTRKQRGGFAGGASFGTTGKYFNKEDKLVSYLDEITKSDLEKEFGSELRLGKLATTNNEALIEGLKELVEHNYYVSLDGERKREFSSDSDLISWVNNQFIDQGIKPVSSQNISQYLNKDYTLHNSHSGMKTVLTIKKKTGEK